MPIEITVDVFQKTDVKIDEDDVIEALNALPLSQRWNSCAKILNEIALNEESLSESQRELVIKWLTKNLRLFKRDSTALLLSAMEYGYKSHEDGKSIQKAIGDFQNLLNGNELTLQTKNPTKSHRKKKNTK